MWSRSTSMARLTRLRQSRFAGDVHEKSFDRRSSLRPLRLSDCDRAAVPALPDVRHQEVVTDRGRAAARPADCAGVTIRHGLRLCATLMARHRRWVAGGAFAAVTLLACVLVGRQLTGSSWPLAHARMLLVAAAGLCYFVSFVARARGWRRLFPHEQCPGQAHCLASVGAAAASGVVLPFRLDYLIKIGTL